jgi:hypothetical protein
MESGDEATLLDVSENVERGMARCLTVLADFLAVELPATVTAEDGTTKPGGIVVEMNKEFVRSDLTARELRAIQSLYTSGLIPLDVLYYALRSVNVIPIEYTLEDFTAMMGDSKQLYPDPTGAEARREALRNKVEVARISAHVDEPAKTSPVPGIPGARATLTPVASRNTPANNHNNPPDGAPS